MRIGIYVFGLATIAAGVINLVWGDFESGHQPIQAFGDNIPGRAILAYSAAFALVASGAALLWPRTAKPGAAVAAFIYLAFAVFWMPRLVTVPLILGFQISIMIFVLAGIAQQLILVAAAVILYASAAEIHSEWRERAGIIGRWIFGLCSVVFGLSHLLNIQGIAPLVPAWMPLGGGFWAVFTGVAFLLAGAAILTRIQDVLASRLLALMLVVFSALVLLPPLFVAHPDHVSWGSNAYNLAAIAACWIFAESLAKRRANRSRGAAAEPAAA